MSDETDPQGSANPSDAGWDLENVENLTGPKIPPKADNYAVLRIPMRLYGQHFVDRSQLMTRLGVVVPKADLTLPTDIAESSSYIYGPFSDREILELLDSQLLSGLDEVQFSGGRWRSIKDLYPEHRAKFWRSSEMTGTHSLTNTVTSTATLAEENHREDTPTDDLYGEGRVPLERVVEDVAKEVVEEERSRVQTSGAAYHSTATSHSKKVFTPSPIREPKKNQQQLLTVVVGALALVAVLFVLLRPQKTSNTNSITEIPNPSQATQQEVVAEVLPGVRPDSLKENFGEESYWSTSPLLQKLKPAYLAWKKADVGLLSFHEDLLKRFSSPAVSSWEARKLATHLLVNLRVWKEDYRGAEVLLQDIYRAAPSDLLTLTHLSGLSLILGRYPEAKEYANLVERASGADLRWMAWTQLAMADAALGNSVASENAWRSAMHSSPENPWIHLGEAAVLLKQKEMSPKVWNELLQRWSQSDPIYTFERDLPKAVLAAYLTPPNQKTWWLQFENKWSQLRLPSDVLSKIQEHFGVAKIVSMDAPSEIKNVDDLVSAYRFSKFEMIHKSRKVIEKLLNTPAWSSQVWPWTLLGDSALELRDFESATLAYQAALEKDSTSLPALWGLASVSLEKGEWARAESLLRQVEAASKDYPPAQMRIKRVEYLKRLGSFFR